MFLKILQNSQEITHAEVCFLIQLQTWVISREYVTHDFNLGHLAINEDLASKNSKKSKK